MKNGILLIALLVLSLTTFSQNKPDNVDILAGPEIKTGKKEFIDKIFGKDDEGTYVMAKYRQQMTLFYYGNDLSLKKKNTVDLAYDKHDLQYRGLIQMGENFYLFTTYRNKKEKITYLYSQELNKNSLTFKEPKELAKASYAGYKKRESASYGFTISADTNYLMFITDLPAKKDELDRFGLMVFDNEMNEIWSKLNIEVDEKESDFYRYEAQIGNDGKCYLLAKVYDTSRKYKRGEINYTFQMMVYSEDEDEPEVFDVTLEGKFMSDVTFDGTKDGNIQVVGFFADKAGLQNGVFNMLIDGEDYSVSNVETTEFSTDFIVQHSSERQKEKAKRKEAKGKEIAFYSYDIDELVENPDGTITMIGEQYRFYQTCHTDANGNTSCTYHYIYGNIIIVKFDEDGETEWMELIPKYQHTVNDGGYYSSYAIAQLPNGNIKLVFNDDPRNNYYEQNGKLYGWYRNKKKTDIIMYDIKTNGHIERFTLFNSSEEEVMSRPKVSVQIDENEIIILGEAKKTTKFFKLIFEE